MNDVTLELMELKSLGVVVSQFAIDKSKNEDTINEYLNNGMSEGDVADLYIELYNGYTN